MARQNRYQPGARFDQAVIVRALPQRANDYDQMYLLLCDCGNQFTRARGNMRSGRRVRCKGCFARATGDRVRSHGETGTHTYAAWNSMVHACHGRSAPSRPGLREHGITVYEPWRDDYPAFAGWLQETLGPRPTTKHRLARIDVTGHFEPGNLQWMTATEISNTAQRKDRFTDEVKAMGKPTSPTFVGPRKPRGRPRTATPGF